MDRKLVIAVLLLGAETVAATAETIAVRFTYPSDVDGDMATRLHDDVPSDLPFDGDFWLPSLPPASAPKDRLFKFALFSGNSQLGGAIAVDIYGNMIGQPVFTSGTWWEGTDMFFVRKNVSAVLTARFMRLNDAYDRYLAGVGSVPEDTQGLWKKTSGTPGTVIFAGYPVVSGINRDPQDRSMTLLETALGTPFYISTFLPEISTPFYTAPELYLGSTTKPIWVLDDPSALVGSLEFDPPPLGNTIIAQPSRVPSTKAWIGGVTFRSLRAYIRVTPGPGGGTQSHIFEDTVVTDRVDAAHAATPRRVDLDSVPPLELWAIIEANGPGTYRLDMVLEAEADDKVDSVLEHNRSLLPAIPGNPPPAIVGKRVVATLVLTVTAPPIQAGAAAALNALIVTR